MTFPTPSELFALCDAAEGLLTMDKPTDAEYWAAVAGKEGLRKLGFNPHDLVRSILRARHYAKLMQVAEAGQDVDNELRANEEHVFPALYQALLVLRQALSEALNATEDDSE